MTRRLQAVLFGLLYQGVTIRLLKASEQDRNTEIFLPLQKTEGLEQPVMVFVFPKICRIENEFVGQRTIQRPGNLLTLVIALIRAQVGYDDFFLRDSMVSDNCAF